MAEHKTDTKTGISAKKIHQKKLNRRSQQLILALLLAILITILLLSNIGRVLPGVLSFPGRPVYDKSLYGSDEKIILNRPLGLAVSDDSNQIYVCDMGNRRIVVFDDVGVMLFTFGQDRLRIPVYLALDSKDNVYVTDRFTNKVEIFDKDGKYIGEFAHKKLRNPLGIDIDKDNNIYISDVGKRHCIHVFKEDGKLIRSFGQTKKVLLPSKDIGKLYFPNGIDVDDKENIYVADSNNHRVQIFDKNGKAEKIIAMGGLPRGVAYSEKTKSLYVIDTLNHKVSAYDDKGDFRFSFSKQGRGNDELMYPSGITLSKDGKLYITDRNNGRVQVFNTVLSTRDFLQRTLPLLPLISIPWLLLLLALLYSRKRRYIFTDSFIKKAQDKKKLEILLGVVKSLYVTITYHDKLLKANIPEVFRGKIKTRAFDEQFAERLQKEHNLDKQEAQDLALAAHKGLFHPVLLTESKKLIVVAKSFGIEVMDFAVFIEKVEGKKL